jgi:CRISPR-associated exonuclease Cas4
MTGFYFIAGLLILLALAAWWIGARQRKSSGLPDGRVVSTDTGAWRKLEKPLYDPDTGLTGKPDYVVERDGIWVPVEVKSGWAPPEPHEGHIFQLAAYCRLVEHAYGVRPPVGILHYRNRTFEIDYNAVLEADLMALLEDLQIQSRKNEAHRSHNEAGRCARCGYRAICDEKL